MVDKKNNLWRLDLLEAHYLEKPVRFPRTKSLLRVKGKKQAALLPESKEAALVEIKALKSDVFAKKLHSSLSKYSRALKKTIKTALKDKKTTEDEKKFLEGLDTGKLSNIRIVKLVSTVFKLNAKKLSQNEQERPQFVPQWIVDALIDKESDINPSKFYNEMSNVQRNWYSKLMNHKDVSQIAETIESSFKIVLGPVKKEKDQKDIEDVESEESESEQADSEESDSDESDDEDVEQEVGDIDENAFAEYDQFLGDSEEEEEIDATVLDPTIDYNQVTDEEPSDEEVVEEEDNDDFFDLDTEEKKKTTKEKKSKEDKKKEKADKKKKVVLPELQAGFISASEDSDVEDDKVVQEITGAKKKNRRGQRARQKIWEQKYGRGANHVKKEKEEKQKLREQKQKEWEEREARRQAKAAEMTGANASTLGERKSKGDGIVKPLDTSARAIHPSWEAKKKQDAALKNVKFQGKKVVF
ncbi:CYFA0S07e01244g1_1 [Cyberlindnera fabianii]|uniref:CYFA0S07e01244g1_1 n=1 Tax=Cyberlindnera fabianii TaxID=36022 RepID=A0A061B2Y1_CYBFA|nr:CYFA0S07e01244g1_1 [Cyberlindnera fabianii]